MTLDDDEKGEMWAKISDIDKKVALNEQSIKTNRERIDNIVDERLTKANKDYTHMNDMSNRANNIKVAVIGGLFAIVTTIMYMFYV